MAFGDLDQDRIVTPLVGVILLQLGPQAMALHSDDGIDFRIEIVLTPERLDSDCVLFE